MALPLAAGTLVTRRYLSHARVLAESLRAFHPSLPFIVAIVDHEGAPDEGDRFETVAGRSLGAPDFRRLTFAYSGQHLCIALKPVLLQHLLARAEAAVFIDPDILVTAPLDAAFDQVRAHALTLTPHLVRPSLGADARARDRTMLLAGAFNGGFVGVSRSTEAEACLAWWGDRLSTHCRMAPADALHGDQRWLDLAPAFVGRTAILRDPALNVAYWNLHERTIALVEDELFVDGRRLGFFHFSGFDPGSPGGVSAHAAGLTRAALGPIGSLFDDYAARLARHGVADSMRQPYRFDWFDNGVRIPIVARDLYVDLAAGAAAFGDPFAASGPQSFYRWLTGAADPAQPLVSRLWAAVHRARPDLQHRFPDPSGASAPAFAHWARTTGVREHDIDPRLAPPDRAEPDRAPTHGAGLANDLAAAVGGPTAR